VSSSKAQERYGIEINASQLASIFRPNVEIQT